MKITNLKTALAAAALVTASFSFAVAQTPAPAQDGATLERRGGQQHQRGMKRGGKMHKRGFGERHLMKRFAAELGITDAQKQQMKAIKERYKTGTQAQREQLRALRPQAGVATTPDQVARLTALRNELFASRQNMRNEILNVLTADQRAKMQQLAAQARQRMEEFRQRRQQQRSQVQPNSGS